MDSGVAGRGFPAARAILHSFLCFSFLFLFLAAAASAASFCFIITSLCRRLTSRSSGTGGFEMWPLWLTPCKRNQVRNKEWGGNNTKSTKN